MKTYTPAQLVNLDFEQIDQVQKGIDSDALAYLEERQAELSFLSEEERTHLLEYYTDTMEKYRLLYEAIISGFSTPTKPGFPEFIYNINLKDGSIETDRNGRHISYSTEVLAPCTTAMLHYINSECNNVYVILPPIKGVERTTEKLISECIREYKNVQQENLNKLTQPSYEDEPELPFSVESDVNLPFSLRQDVELHCPTAAALNRQKAEKAKANALLNIAQQEILPKDIYRLSITSKYQGDLEEMIRELEEKFPPYIKFEKGERNLYKKNLSENSRNYFDIKKTAVITIPGSNRTFYIEFQFKQTNMFFAHIRSHSAYEEFRILDAKYQTLKETEKKRKLSGLTPNPANRQKLQQLKKQCDEKKDLCLKIHRNAVHQSNLYLMHKLLWLDDNARGLHRKPDYPDGRYQHSIDTLKKNYIIESYEPFDGATAFTTAKDEYLNKSYYLKMIGILPENFDELGKNAKEHINKAWNTLTAADIKDFMRITSMALRYQDDIRQIQKKRRMLEPDILMNVFAQSER